MFHRFMQPQNSVPIGHSVWRCDSIDHNEPTGCSNPQCFKYNSVVDPAWQQFTDIAHKLFKDLREHSTNETV